MSIEQFLGLPKRELTDSQKVLVEKLREIDRGGSNRLVQKIIELVEMGFADSAKLLCFNEADKFRSQPAMIEILSTYLFDDTERKPWSRRRK